MSTNLKETISTLNDLIETCKDGQEGFRLASEAVTNDEDLKTFLFSCSLQRSKFAGELQAELKTLGEADPAESSTVKSALHRGWINLRQAITGGDDHAILAECERGEDLAVAAYRKAVNSGLSDPLREIVQRQFQEVLATHNTVRDMRDEWASLKPASRSVGEVAGDLQTALGERGRALGAQASESWDTARAKTGDVLATTETYVRENPFPAILTALGIGFGLGLLVRLLEPEDREHIQVPIPRGVRKARDFDYKAAALPFLWPIVKFFSANYAKSAKAVDGAYGQANKAYKKARNVDVSDYVEPLVKKVRKSFR